jgi:hypothetical protein
LNYIFNSDIYLKYTDSILEQDNNLENSDSKQIKEKPEVADNNVEDDNIEAAETDEATYSEKKQNFQKYLLYYKLRDLEYKLNDYKVLQTYKNTKEVKDFLLVLGTFLKFYNAFDYKEASNLATNILIQFKKIK